MTGQQELAFKTRSLARATDSESSHRAAEGMVRTGKLGGHRLIIVDGLRDHPDCTAGELAQYIELDYVQIDRRVGKMEKDGVIESRGSRFCTVNETHMHEWRVKG